MIVQHNMTAENNRRQLGIVEKRLSTTTEKLSSGYRVNRAADDAAGLSISEKMRAQVRGLKRASLNTSDGISLVQTAEGGMNEIHSILQRMEELSVQAANDTNTDEDRETIQLEIDALVEEIDRIAETTEFNTMRLLSGEYAAPAGRGVSGGILNTPAGTVHLFYTDLNQTINGSVTQEVRVGTSTAGSAATAGADEIGLDPDAYTNLKDSLKNSIVPQAVNAILSAYPDTFGYLNGSNLGIGLSLESDSGSDTLASVTMGRSGTGTQGADGSIDWDVQLSYNLNVNCATLQFDSNGNLTPESRDALEVTIVHEMTHALMDEALTVGMSGTDENMNSVNPFPSWFIEGTAQASAGGGYSENDWVQNGLGITTASSAEDIANALAANALNSGTGTADYGTGYLAAMYLGYLANGGTGTPTASGIASGLDMILSDIRGNAVLPEDDPDRGTDRGTNLDDAIAAHSNGKYENQADFELGFASDPDAVQFVSDLVTAMGDGAGGLVGSFFNEIRRSGDTGDFYLPDDDTASTVFTLDTDHETVSNDYPDDHIVMSGGSGGVPSGGRGLLIQVGANAEQVIYLYIAEMTAKAIGIDGADVTTTEAAEKTIDAVQNAVRLVSFHRVTLGAYQNRMDHAILNADNMAENVEAAESKIRDADMAREMVQYSASQILMQAGQAMLSQTNQMTQGVVQLLR